MLAKSVDPVTCVIILAAEEEGVIWKHLAILYVIINI